MNKVQSEKWKNDLVGEVFKAVVAHEALKNALVFKGARVLNIHLGTERQSLDIDSNFLAEFIEKYESRCVDCIGLSSFQEAWEVTQQAYENDATLSSIPFCKAEGTLDAIITFFQKNKNFPFINEG